MRKPAPKASLNSSTQLWPHSGVSACAGSVTATVAPAATVSAAETAAVMPLADILRFLPAQRPCPHGTERPTRAEGRRPAPGRARMEPSLSRCLAGGDVTPVDLISAEYPRW